MSETVKIQKTMDVANFVVDIASSEGRPVTNLKLQKVLFFLQGFCLDNYNSPIVDGSFAKWKYGPVEEEVYQEYKSNGSSPIDNMGLTWKYNSEGNFEIVRPKKMTEENIGNSSVFEEIKNFTNKLLLIEPWKLVEITHKHDTWNIYKDKIMLHLAENYTNCEILSCYRDSKKELLGA